MCGKNLADKVMRLARAGLALSPMFRALSSVNTSKKKVAGSEKPTWNRRCGRCPRDCRLGAHTKPNCRWPKNTAALGNSSSLHTRAVGLGPVLSSKPCHCREKERRFRHKDLITDLFVRGSVQQSLTQEIPRHAIPRQTLQN